MQGEKFWWVYLRSRIVKQALILSMLLSLPPAYEDRAEPGRDARMATIADAVAQSVDRARCEGYTADCEPIWIGSELDIGALVVTVGWWESRFSRRIHAGQCRPDECDPFRYADGRVVHRARSCWQAQRTGWSRKLWGNLEGTGLEPTRNAAWVATTVLAEGQRRCKSTVGAIAFYACGRCSWSGAKRRVATWEKLRTL